MRHTNALVRTLALGLLFSSIQSFGQSAATPGQTASTQKGEQISLPTPDEINVLVTQAERAFAMYENTLRGSGISVANDQRLLTDAKDVISHIKVNPQYFNAPMGFLLVSDLGDASRNMVLCAFQESNQANMEIVLKRGTDTALDAANSKIHVAQSFIDTSALLQTVGETAFNLYERYLAANFQADEKMSGGFHECMQTLQKCATALKKEPARN